MMPIAEAAHHATRENKDQPQIHMSRLSMGGSPALTAPAILDKNRRIALIHEAGGQEDLCRRLMISSAGATTCESASHSDWKCWNQVK
jgi:hypothetical protein